jgi:hypothetical protein
MKQFILSLFLSNPLMVYPTGPNQSTFPHFCSKKDPDFLEIRYQAKVAVCKRSVSSSTKAQVYEDYSIPVSDQKSYTIDHLVPLSMGGSNNRWNLWPQHKDISTANYEGELYRSLNSAKISHQEALNSILEKKLK